MDASIEENSTTAITTADQLQMMNSSSVVIEENNVVSVSSIGYERKLSSDGDDKDTSVRVAVRIRPQIPREIIDMCRICTTVTPGEPQVVLGGDKAFTFDYVFDINSTQTDIYAKCVEKLVDGSLKGYNATVLAYGQTGSGKTYTMGTGFDCDVTDIQEGIIPRAVRHIFSGIENLQTDENGVNRGTIQFSVAAQFMELYNEDIIDLLDPYNKGRVFKIHEDPAGGIYVSGATITPIHGPQDALKCLQQGALARTTASTQMNAQSSRSHALFTILIRRQRALSPEECGLPEGDLETLTSKFHFVDLAGSERLKRTGATGERAREGISINCGLLALGNVISALGDKSKRATHVPYRDSKLTRLLQDSLGGNSQTLMIACVSPSDRDFMETLNTLKYANRARNIKNKVLLNQDQSSRTIMQLRREIAALQIELLEYKQGKRSIDEEGNASISDTFQENAMLLADNKRLQQRLKAMQETINTLTDKNSELMLQKATMGWQATDSEKSVADMIGAYITEIEKLQAKLLESEQMYQQLKKSMTSPRNNFKMNNTFETPETILNMAKHELEKERELLMSRSLPGFNEDSSNSNVENNDSDSDSDTESDDKTGQMQAELNDISSDIELKTKLIEQLELSQQRMQVMRQHYEEKLHILNTKIMNTQKERDQVLSNMGSAPQTSQSNEKIKKVREEYERKINDMQRELRKLQSAQKEHVRLQRQLQSHESQLKTLRNELSDLKAMKTRLMRKMQEESNRHKEEESRKVREIAQLRKESRKQLNTIKSLQAQGAAKDQVLKRRTEEVTALRKSQRGMLSLKAQGRVQPKKTQIFSPRQARLKWENLQRTISRTVESKKTIVQLESELERLIHDREALSRDLANVRNKLRQNETPELISEEDTLKANLNYVQEVMTQIQHSIIDIEEGKESTSSNQLQSLIDNVQSVEEAKYLLEKLANITVAQTCDNTLAQTKLSENEARIKEFRDESDILQQLMQHILAQNPALTFSDLSQNFEYTKQRCSESWSTIDSNSTYDIPSDMPSILSDSQRGREMTSNHVEMRNHQNRSSRSPSPAPTIDLDHTSKVRRRTAQPQDLLFGDADNQVDKNDIMTRSFTQQEGAGRSFIPLARVPSAPGSLKQALNNTASPSLGRKPIDTTGANAVPVSPRVNRRPFPNKGSPGFTGKVRIWRFKSALKRQYSLEDS
ncbi:kinesin-like protein KIF21A isoform X3 [Hermetia illucens]|uniref:kinesin-like protein KIF21A isoform X3 n=1 Tax=Hermetia illucens TaxID=343691 RepID=UPI0018CBFAE4|nr:kinesin-like protein KIF21A isoform X3 [Hermetia illucens]